MSTPVKPIPDGYDALVPYLVCRGAANAIDFYQQLFGATEKFRMPYPDGKLIAHAEIVIRGHVLMLGDENPQFNCLSPLALNGPSPVTIMIYVPNVDDVFAKAQSLGVKTVMPPMDMFWGDRYCKFTDPFGHAWAVATHIKELSPEEIARASVEAFKEKANCA